MGMPVIDPARLVESWTWYGFATAIFIWRMISRSMLCGGWLRLAVEDWLMCLTFACYTNLIVWINIQAQYPITNILPPGVTTDMLSPAEISAREYGSVVTFTIEQSMLCVQWGTKFCVLLMFYRLTTGLRDQLFVKILMAYSALGFVVMELFFLCIWCRPFANYFVVSDDNSIQCETSGNHLIMSFAFNISSDLLILIIPARLFLRSQLPRKKKFILYALFSLGIFVCVCATLNRYYCFAFPDSILWIFWYVREASTAILVANIPNCYTLVRRILGLREWSYIGTVFTFGRRGQPSRESTMLGRSTMSRQMRTSRAGHGIPQSMMSQVTWDEESDGGVPPMANASQTFSSTSKVGMPLEIWQRSEFHVEDEHIDDSDFPFPHAQTQPQPPVYPVAQPQVSRAAFIASGDRYHDRTHTL